MTVDTYKKALTLAELHGDSISIGGGEPTIHPHFWEFLGLALGAEVDEGLLWMATNGSQTQTALSLARMARRGVLGVALSLDAYHDPIDPQVIKAFKRDAPQYGGFDSRTSDAREIRDVTGKEIRQGRCKKGKVECCCSDIHIKPDGTIRGCGCPDAPTFGTVDAPEIPDNWTYGECSKQQPTDSEE
jgi:MoaA/NifB/PqqE/SkfB family radical SAM enzyme